jgi:hypothetical protein
MTETRIPSFAELLAPFIQKIADGSRPAFLAALERGAAQRYREWAEDEPEHAAGLRACAEREEEIARRVDALFPADASGRTSIEHVIPEARDAYYRVFAGLPVREQWRIQASAEREGALAWRTLAAEQDEDHVRKTLLGCAALEEESAAHLDALLRD